MRPGGAGLPEEYDRGLCERTLMFDGRESSAYITEHVLDLASSLKTGAPVSQVSLPANAGAVARPGVVSFSWSGGSPDVTIGWIPSVTVERLDFLRHGRRGGNRRGAARRARRKRVVGGVGDAAVDAGGDVSLRGRGAARPGRVTTGVAAVEVLQGDTVIDTLTLPNVSRIEPVARTVTVRAPVSDRCVECACPGARRRRATPARP